ncbi:DUF3048 domain-containing protein [Nocardioides sp. zg-536]|uniref:DUF3048 domain-containing protein n=1 Tax=Nocardioides faecalis TaxID=2803858 RepID=A0A938Y7U6_9ACTN|nr:DUF3048 domain-containing protein [Nocardioides faecalis]MBM9460814.1 DUF3048 domain-containing protein [Nocardioides faecalis]QVI58003.1 DUF3048 domain-containing protein [Nocardioides faecalis]
MRTSILRSALPASLLALSLVLTGCGGGEEEKKPASGETSSAPEPEVPATWPLTGEETDTEVELDHPVVVAKIDNSKSSAPQVGLGKADMVVEELVEGGITRLAAFYYSRLPKEIGPVRSMRASDIGIVTPVDAVIAASGAAAPTIGRLDEAGVKFFTEGGPGYFRKQGRYAPYNLFTSLAAVGKAAEDGKNERPADYLPWGTPQDLPEGAVATTIAADFGRHTTNWQFKNGTYVNTNSFAAEGDRFKPDTVLVLRVDVVDAGYRDPAGNFVPESRFRGGGQAQLFHNGTVVEGEWSKKKLSSPLKLTTAEGTLKVPAGKVWIELVPVDSAGGSVTFGK